ncbi:MAG: formate dehydrogenase subunit alpha [Pseudomonadota bacterium]
MPTAKKTAPQDKTADDAQADAQTPPQTPEQTLTLNGETVTIQPGETLWELVRRTGDELPHLCHKPGYRPDGNCRICMVAIEGERALVASCVRPAAPGMVIDTQSSRPRRARELVAELLLADQPRAPHDPTNKLLRTASKLNVTESRFPAAHKTNGADHDANKSASGGTSHNGHNISGDPAPPAPDFSHPAMAVQLDACIHCGLCVRACREEQVNDVIGMAHRGQGSKIVFDMDDPMGHSTCVACGECVQACPTGALMPASVLDETTHKRTATPDRHVDTLCPYCGVGCQVRYHVKDDQIIAAEGRPGPANQSRLCVKGRFGFDYGAHPDRLTTPLIRRDDAPKTPELPSDPEEIRARFRAASWEEALDRAGNGLAQIKAAHGADALAGFGSAKGSNEEAYLFQKLVRTGFGTHNVDHCTRLCHAASVAALMETIGSGAVTAPVRACKDSDVMLLIGANPTVNHPVAATFLKNALKRGAKLILADPRGQELSRHAHIDMRFKPGTDVALLNAMIHVILREGLADEAYIRAHTHGIDALHKATAQTSPEAMAPLCGIDAETLRAAARLFGGAKAAMIFWGMGISQHAHGTDNARCLIDLALITGQVGRAGTGLHPLRGQNNVQGASDAGLIPMMLPDYQKVIQDSVRDHFADFWQTELAPSPGLTVVEIINAAFDGTIKGMYIQGENPAMSDPDLTHARTGLSRLEHLVVQDLFITETASYADVILPASSFFEKDGTFTNTDRRVQRGRQVLPLPGEAKPDWWIIGQMAQRLGLDWGYETVADIFAEMRETMPSIKGLSWDRVSREGSVTYPVEHEDDPGQEIIFADGFPTDDGRGTLVPATLSGPAEPPDPDYPLILSTGRLLEHWHTGAMTRRAKVLDQLEPSPAVYLHPRELARAGLTAGTPVRVRTRRGTIELAAVPDRHVSMGCLFIPFAFAEAAANLLTIAELDPHGKIPEFKYCAARLEMVTSPAPTTNA